MTDLLTSGQMRALETEAIESCAVTGRDLMERAGQGVVAAIYDAWPEMVRKDEYLGRDEGGLRAVVLCGPGNNGGDGFVVARLLHARGWAVEVFLYGDAGKLPPDARANYARWCEIGGVGSVSDILSGLGAGERFDLFIDAVFGTGLTRGLPQEISEIALAVSDLDGAPRGRVVAVDMPSGLCADSGRVVSGARDAVFPSDLVVTFHSEKIGHRLADGPEICGRTVVADIGLGEGDVSGAQREIVRLVGCPVGVVAKRTRGHKFHYGHALVLSGGAGRTGAARLAARGALRIGAGLVTLGVPGSAQMEVAAQVTAVMLRRAGTAEELAKVLEDGRINALCLGPGLGVARARALVPVALGGGMEMPPNRAMVLDADALTGFAEAPEALFGRLHERCVLTPHGGEFARLFPDLAERLGAPAERGPAYSKVDATRAAAARAGCVVVYKGADTVIAAPDGRCSLHAAVYERAAPWLATAGAGDVLAGFITGLLARGLEPMMAAEAGAWLHAECARVFGAGLIAEDLPERLPGVLAGIGA